MTAESPARAVPFVPHRGRGTALILLASLFFGSSGAIGKPAMLAGLDPEQVAAARIGLSAVVLLVCVGLVRPSLLRVPKGGWRLLAGYGLLGVAGVQLLYFVAAARIPVGVAILLEFTSPILIALWVRFVRRVRLPGMLWFGTALALCGLAMVAQFWEGLRLDALGLLAGLGAAVCSAAYFLLGERGVASQHPLGMVTWGMVIGGVAVCVVAPPWTLPGTVLTAPAEFGPWHPPVWTLLFAVALVSTVLAYLAGISALRHLPAPVASVLGLCEPLVATALAWFLLGEALTWWQVLGAAVLLTGATIVQLNSPEKAPPEPLPVTPPPSDPPSR
ncbi:EamA family transporter [Amycolatopsis suaedae]|uniref:EamA family transporter n=1 Tax=Amycolatopsis suaedae TaxID=2510978 RepID=A0A4Q7IZD5_9PSEU|nr:EamA family transporter [Amycolatopsis suaedae]RZQ59798.1 EamA family transporter [Amycolatopsis suaedae]